MITDHKRLYEATHVTVKEPSHGQTLSFDGRTMPIILDTGEFVWVEASYADNTPEGVVQVGDGRNKSYSQNGQRILSVPASWCTFLTDEEAECIERCMDADSRLLSYAR